jgi:hypothetical protein
MAARTLGEWCRELMLTSANGQPAKATRTADEFHVLMAEVVALRAILLNVLFKQANAEPLRAEGMQRLIERADSGKLREARERLEQASGSNASEDCQNVSSFFRSSVPSIDGEGTV